MDIYDINILDLIKQYLYYINQLDKENLEVATEFLEMASRLVYIKSEMLLPKHEDAGELASELKGQLIEYRLIKKIAENMNMAYVGDKIFCRKPMDIDIDLIYKKIHDKKEIKDAFILVIGKQKRRLPPDRKEFSDLVERTIISVKSRIVFVMKNLYKNGKISFKKFFNKNENTSEKVATFLALLELIKNKNILISDDNETIYLNQSRRVGKK